MPRCFIFKSVIISSFIVIIGLALVVQAWGIEKDSQYELKNSYLRIQRTSRSQKISLVKKENGEEITEEVELADEYLLSNIPENEFLNKYLSLKPGFRDLKISIEVDQPLFAKENFYHPRGILDKAKSLFGSESLPEYRIRKEIKPLGANLETKLEIPGLNLETYYERRDEGIKQKLVLENNSGKEINLELRLAHSIGSSEILFNGETYLISEIPQSLSPKASSSISFISNLDEEFTYDFSDLLEFNPSIWIFRKDSKNILLVEIPLSITSGSSIIIDPSYEVDTTNTATATAYSFQRKTWYDGSRYWVSFWTNLENRVEFHYMISSSWTENTSARYSLDSNDFSILCDSSDCYLVGSNGSDITVTKATGYPASNFGWDTATTVEAGGPAIYYTHPYINRDGSDYLWVIYRYFYDFGLGSYRIYSRKSAKDNNVSAWELRDLLNNTTSDNYGSVIAPIDSSADMYAVWLDDITLEGNKFTKGGGWGTATTIAESVGSRDIKYSMSILNRDDKSDYDLHLLYPGQGGSELRYKRYFNGSWSDPVLLHTAPTEALAPVYITISVDNVSQNLYAFWGQNLATSFYYRKGIPPYTSSTDWSVKETFYSSAENNDIDWLTSNYTGDGGRIFAEWTEATSVFTYSAMWADVPMPCTLGSVMLNSGNSISLNEGVSTTITATGTFSDPNGWQDVAGGGQAAEIWQHNCEEEVRLYRSGVSGGEACNENDNNCYGGNGGFTCATSNCSSNSCDFSVSRDVWFHADPTDSGTWESEDWRFYMYIEDLQSNTDTASTNEELNTLHALDVSTSSIDYGSLNPGADTGTLNQTTTVTDTGNAAIDIYLYGDDIESALSSIAVGQQEYDVSSSTSYGSGTDATSTVTNKVELDLSKPTAHSPNTSTDDIYWGLGIPSVQKAGSYTGTTTFEAKPDIDCDGYYWDGYCWYEGENRQPCSDLCEEHGGNVGSCQENDNESCDLCHYYYPGADCEATHGTFGPAYELSHGVCVYREETEGECKVGEDGYDRFCACND